MLNGSYLFCFIVYSFTYIMEDKKLVSILYYKLNDM